MLRVELRRERLEGRVEIVAEIRLDALAAPGDREARAEARDAVADREQHDQRDVVADRGGRRMRLERVDRSLHRPGDCQRRERRGGETDDAEGVAGPVSRASPPRAA